MTVLQIAGVQIPCAELAYLSACQTCVGGVRLLDEAIHLAAAMQLAGYQHVIATQWFIDDARALDVTAAVYRILTENERPSTARAADALHRAVSDLRRSYQDQPLLWAPYLHTGA